MRHNWLKISLSDLIARLRQILLFSITMVLIFPSLRCLAVPLIWLSCHWYLYTRSSATTETARVVPHKPYVTKN